MPYLSRRAGTLFTALAAVLFALPVRAASPAPRAVPAAPAPGAYVNDNAGVMDAGAAAQLNAVLADLDAKAKAQVAVLTVKSLGGSDIETYAVKTYAKWGIGDKKTNRGVLLLVAVQDHRARIEVGYGLEGILPDGLTGEIQDKYIIPFFKTGDYSSGISQGALAIASVISRDSGVQLSAGPADDEGEQNLPPLTPGQKILAAILIVLVLIFAIRHPFLMFFIINAMGSRGGFGGGFGGGGFGGFGGGLSGGGGSSRSW